MTGTQPDYEQIIYTFRFDDQCSIKIPKSIRERAFDLSVDIIVHSVGRPPYQNYKTLPSNSFYGYAVLVLEDFCSKPISIEQPRQRLYSGRVSEAFEMWQNYFNQDQNLQIGKGIETLICSVISQLGGECEEKECVPPPLIRFIELPLREVYIKGVYGMSFSLEVSYTRASPYANICGETIVPKSGMDDGAKDGGLPNDGVQPHTASDPNNPFQNTVPPDSPSDLGEFYNEGKEESVDDIPESNEPLQTTYHVVLRVEDYIHGCGGDRYALSVDVSGELLEPPSSYSLRQDTPYQTCFNIPAAISTIIINGVEKGQAQGIGAYLFLASFPKGYPTDGLYYDWKKV